MNDLFILSYIGSSFVEEHCDIKNMPNTNVYILDNGRQKFDALSNNIIYTTKHNIGCAGGWNLICDIAFNHLNLDKVIITNDDNVYTEEVLDNLTNYCNENTISTAYNRGFEYSLFCIHKETFEKVGRFDENCLFVTCEDNDYKHRCRLNNIGLINFDMSADYNLSLTSKTMSRYTTENARYMIEKWGNNYIYSVPFNGHPPYIIRHNVLNEYKDKYIEGDIYKFPSEYEYSLFINQTILNYENL